MNTGIRMSKLLMVRSATYNDQVARPYQTNVDGIMLNQLREATQGGHQTNAGSLAGVAGAILRPQANAAANIQIANGWETHRFRFLMELELPMQFGGGMKQVMTGYSDYFAVTADGKHIDPGMRLYFNNSIATQIASSTLEGIGTIQQMRVADASHILIPPAGYGAGVVPAAMQTMRPEDVMNAISTSAITDGDVMDFRTTFAVAPVKKSRRTNCVAPEYMSRVISAIDQAHRIDGSNLDHASVYQEARSTVREALPSQDIFLAILQQRSNYLQTGYITYGELCAIFPETEHVRTTVMPGNTAQQHLATPDRGSSEYWHIPTNEAVAATIMSHACSAIMMELMLTRTVFVATNMTLNSQIDIQMRAADGFSQNIDMSPYLQRFIHRMTTEVLADITRNNMFQLWMEVSCNILGDTQISVSLNGGPKILYITPSFCDGLISPVIAADNQALSTMGHDIELMYSHITGNNINPFQATNPLAMTQFHSGTMQTPTIPSTMLPNQPQGVAHGYTASNDAI